MTKPIPDARPGRGIKSDIYKLLDNNKEQILDSLYPHELIYMLCEGYSFHHSVDNSTALYFSNEWIEENNIDTSDKV